MIKTKNGIIFKEGSNLMMIPSDSTLVVKMKDGTFMKEADFLFKIKSNPKLFTNVINPSKQLMIKFLNNDSLNLQYIENQTESLILHALKINTSSVEIIGGSWYISSPTLKYVKEQTPEICLEALKICQDYLKYVKIVEFNDLRDCIKKLKAKQKLMKVIKNVY